MPNRIVAITTALLGLAAALAPVIANLDWESTAAVIAGVGVVAAAALKWLEGWQRYEERTDLEGIVAQQIGQPPDAQPRPEGAIDKPTLRGGRRG